MYGVIATLIIICFALWYRGNRYKQEAIHESRRSRAWYIRYCETSDRLSSLLKAEFTGRTTTIPEPLTAERIEEFRRAHYLQNEPHECSVCDAIAGIADGALALLQENAQLCAQLATARADALKEAADRFDDEPGLLSGPTIAALIRLMEEKL